MNVNRPDPFALLDCCGRVFVNNDAANFSVLKCSRQYGTDLTFRTCTINQLIRGRELPITYATNYLWIHFFSGV